MITMLNRTVLLHGLKISKYHKLTLNLKPYLCSISSAKFNTSPARETHGYFNQMSSKAIKIHNEDGVPPDYDIIYTSFDYHGIAQRLFTGLPIGVTLIGIGHIIIDYTVIFPDPFTTALNLWLGIFYYWVTIAIAFYMYKTPLRIYHNKKTGIYKAVFYDLLPYKKRTLEFTKGSVEQLEPPDELTLFYESRYRIKNQNVYMFEDYFRYPADLYNMFNKVEVE